MAKSSPYNGLCFQQLGLWRITFGKPLITIMASSCAVLNLVVLSVASALLCVIV